MDTLVYAFCFFRREDIGNIERAIREIKKLHGFPQDVPLHFSALMNPFSREKAGLQSFSNDSIKALISSIVEFLNEIPFLLRYSYYTITGNEADDKPDDDNIPVYFEEKGIICLLCQDIFVVDANGSCGPSANECQIFVSEERTKIKFLGEKRQRADRWFRGYSDIGAPKGYVYHLNPIIKKSNEIDLLQIADIFSYICSHAKSTKCADSYYSHILNKVKNRIEHSSINRMNFDK